jgi:hypothetical protein
MIEPLPNCRSIWASAVSRDFSLSPALPPALSLPAMDTPVGVKGFLSARRYAPPLTKLRAPGPLRAHIDGVPLGRPSHSRLL